MIWEFLEFIITNKRKDGSQIARDESDELQEKKERHS